MHLIIGSRKSPLAMRQSEIVETLLQSHGHTTEIKPLDSKGDQILDTPLPLIGGKGLFTQALDKAMLANEIDIAVHSLKDIPTEYTPGLEVSAILPRDNWRDTLYSNVPSEDICSIATSSPRRHFQWIEKYANTIDVKDIRGNIHTRMRKIDEQYAHGTLLAAAGLERMNIVSENVEILDWMLPAPGQGAIAVVCSSDKPQIRQALMAIHDEETALCVEIERQFLSDLGGGCSSPVGALATIQDEIVSFTCVVYDPSGKKAYRNSAKWSVQDPIEATLMEWAAEANNLLRP